LRAGIILRELCVHQKLAATIAVLKHNVNHRHAQREPINVYKRL